MTKKAKPIAIDYARAVADVIGLTGDMERAADIIAAAMAQAHARGRREGLEVSRRMAQAAIDAGYKTDGRRWIDTIERALATDEQGTS